MRQVEETLRRRKYDENFSNETPYNMTSAKNSSMKLQSPGYAWCDLISSGSQQIVQVKSQVCAELELYLQTKESSCTSGLC